MHGGDGCMVLALRTYVMCTAICPLERTGTSAERGTGGGQDMKPRKDAIALFVGGSGVRHIGITATVGESGKQGERGGLDGLQGTRKVESGRKNHKPERLQQQRSSLHCQGGLCGRQTTDRCMQ